MSPKGGKKKGGKTSLSKTARPKSKKKAINSEKEGGKNFLMLLKKGTRGGNHPKRGGTGGGTNIIPHSAYSGFPKKGEKKKGMCKMLRKRGGK